MTDTKTPPEERQNLKRAILIINLIMILFPPIHLWFADGSMNKALLYFAGSGILVILSLLLLRSIDGPGSED